MFCRGLVTCYKLSPNLRRAPQPPKSGAAKERGAQRRDRTGPQGGVDSAQGQAVEDTAEEKARKAAALQRDHLGKVLSVAAACRTAEAEWVFTPRPTTGPSL